MAVYKKRKGSDTWHWCSNCSKYPTGHDMDVSYSKPRSGELCNECKSKESAGTCRS